MSTLSVRLPDSMHEKNTKTGQKGKCINEPTH
jgi:hypothetical protein